MTTPHTLPAGTMVLHKGSPVMLMNSTLVECKSKQITPDARKAWAKKFGINEQYLYQCLTGRKDLSPKKAGRIEVESKGVLTRQMLCQNTWRATWPELAKKALKAAPKDQVVA